MKKVGVVTVTGLVVAIIGVIAPVLWDHYKTKSSLELQIISKITIIDTKEGIDKLSVIYDKKKIPSITKYTFVLVNSGRTPILQKDVVDYPQISFQPANEILEARIGNLSPLELQIKPFIDASKNILVVKFPLLNPSDRMEINIFVSGSDPKFSALTRIAGINQLQISDKTKDTQKFKNFSWPLLIVMLAVVFCLFMSIALLSYYCQRSEMKRLWENGSIIIPNNIDKKEYVNFIKNTFSPVLAGTAFTSLLNTLNLLTTDEIDPAQQKIVISEISKMLESVKEPLYASLSFGLIGIAGIGFIIYAMM